MLRFLKPGKAILVSAEKTVNLNMSETTQWYGCNRAIQFFLRNIESIVLDLLPGLLNGVKEDNNLAKVAIKIWSAILSYKQTART